MKIAIIHDWLVTYAGAERVLEQMLICFPEADLYCLLDFLPAEDRAFLKNIKITTSFLQKLPFIKNKYRSFLPLMTIAIEQFDLSDYDLIISSTHAVAKGVLVGPDQLHISYVHTPIRYAWDMQHQYLRESNLATGLKGLLARYLLHKIRIWDNRTANGVDYFIANSRYIGRRINHVYHRSSDVIYPPVSTERFTAMAQKETYYLTVSRMVPYKKIPLIIEAFTQMPDKKLLVIGDGPEFDKCRAMAAHASNINLLGWQENAQVVHYLQSAKAFVFAAEEDFGIAPVEAQACGTPVIAFAKGGARETVLGLDHHTPTGVFFYQQTAESIKQAVTEFEHNQTQITPANCRINAERFSEARFRDEFSQFVLNKYTAFTQTIT